MNFGGKKKNRLVLRCKRLKVSGKNEDINLNPGKYSKIDNCSWFMLLASYLILEFLNFSFYLILKS